MDFNAFQTSVAQWVQKLGIEDYELYYQSAESTHVSIYRQEVNEFSSAVDGGVCFRCIVKGLSLIHIFDCLRKSHPFPHERGQSRGACPRD